MQTILLLSEIFPPTSGGSGRWFYELYRRINDKQVFVYTHCKVQTELSAFPCNYTTADAKCRMGNRSLIGLGFIFSVLACFTVL